jgi:hypothetical protein
MSWQVEPCIFDPCCLYIVIRLGLAFNFILLQGEWGLIGPNVKSVLKFGNATNECFFLNQIFLTYILNVRDRFLMIASNVIKFNKGLSQAY